jgi:hypothetical protein
MPAGGLYASSKHSTVGQQTLGGFFFGVQSVLLGSHCGWCLECLIIPSAQRGDIAAQSNGMVTIENCFIRLSVFLVLIIRILRNGELKAKNLF